jgi:ABC-type Fe3+/spermidine/putrescine transport system ATPase subunit
MTEWSVEGLSARIDGFQLGPVSFALAPGDCLAIVGPVGAGKTTLLRALAGFVPRTGGSVRSASEEIAQAAPHTRGIGFVPQGLGLFPHLSVRENIAYGGRFRPVGGLRSDVNAWIDRFGLRECSRRSPATLSGGEQQRVALARALSSHPELLLWDEPMSQMDVRARDALVSLLQGMLGRDGIPLLLVTHDTDTALALAERLLVLEGGKERFLGPVAEAITRPCSPFAARFVGYENVFSVEELPQTRELLGTRLRDACGTEGVCFPATAVRVERAEGVSRARLLHRSPTPTGTRFVVEVDGLHLNGFAPGAVALPTPLAVNVDPAALTPVGTGGGPNASA